MEAARHLQREHGGQLGPDVHPFIDESWRRARARSRAARLRIASLLTVSVVVALFMASMAYEARNAQAAAEDAKDRADRQAKIANDLSRLTVARRRMKTDPTTSLLFLRDMEDPGAVPTWNSYVRNALDEPLTQEVLKGHTEAVLWVDFSRDGQWIATGSSDGTARVWDKTGKEFQRYPGDRPVTRVAFSPDGHWLVASTEDGEAHVHSMEQESLPKPFAERLRAVAFSPDSPDINWVVTATMDNSVKLWRGLEGVEPLHVLQEKGRRAVKQVAFSPKGTHVLVVSQDRVRVWRVDGQGGPVEIPKSGITSAALGTDSITSAALSPDNTHMAVTVSEERVKVLRVSDGKILWNTCTDSTMGKMMTRAEFSPDGEQVLLITSDSLVAQARKLKEASCDGTTFSGHTSDITRATFSPDGKWVLTASNDGSSRLWPVASDTRSPLPVLVARGHRNGVTWAAFSPDGKSVVTGAKDMTARVWGLNQGPRFSEKFQHSSSVWAFVVSPDQRYIASGSDDGTVRVWSSSGHMLARMEGHKGLVTAIAFSRDSQWLVTGGREDETLRLWPLSGLKSPRINGTVVEATDTVPTPNVRHKAMAFSPFEGVRRVATGGSDGRVHLCKLEGSGTETRLKCENFPSHENPSREKQHDEAIRSIAFNSTGDWLITASEDKLVKVWDVATGKLRKSLRGHTDWVRSATFSRNDQFALTASQDGSARVWDLRQEEPQGIIFKHDVAVRWAAFSPDEDHFATAAVDGLVRVWGLKDKDKKEPQPTLVLSGHEDEVTSIVYMDEERLVTSSIDHTVRLWNNIESESSGDAWMKLRKELDKATSLCLGPAEWAFHIGGEFPESSRQRYKQCEQRRAQKMEPSPRVSTKGGE